MNNNNNNRLKGSINMHNDSRYKDGHALTSKYWLDKKKDIKTLPLELLEILIGCLLGDGCKYKFSVNSKIKIEQGAIHKDYLASDAP